MTHSLLGLGVEGFFDVMPLFPFPTYILMVLDVSPSLCFSPPLNQQLPPTHPFFNTKMSSPSSAPASSPFYFGTDPSYAPIPPLDMSAYQTQPAPSVVDEPGVIRNLWTGEETFQGPTQVDVSYTEVWVQLVCSVFERSNLLSLLVS